eukprot:8280296-Karenia_brevis.AAC.1
MGLTQHNISPDYMHTKHLGIDMYFLASILVLLVSHILPYTSTQNLQTVWMKIQEAYKKNKTPSKYQKLTLKMFVVDPAKIGELMPMLKGRASQVKHLVRALVDVWPHFMDG